VAQNTCQSASSTPPAPSISPPIAANMAGLLEMMQNPLPGLDEVASLMHIMK
jgi:hypothetical protein